MNANELRLGMQVRVLSGPDGVDLEREDAYVGAVGIIVKVGPQGDAYVWFEHVTDGLRRVFDGPYDHDRNHRTWWFWASQLEAVVKSA